MDVSETVQERMGSVMSDCNDLLLTAACFWSWFFADMSASGPKEAIDAINACAELSDPEKAAAIAKCIDSNVVAVIVATPASLRVATIRQLLASSQASSSAQSAGQLHSVAQRLVDNETADMGRLISLSLSLCFFQTWRLSS